MKNRLIIKGLVLGMILLFVGAGIIPSTVGIIKKKMSISNPVSLGYIQDLIDNASDGDIINIPSGTYYENIVIDKSISLIGENKNTTIIDGNDFDNVISIIGDSVNISGFTIQNGSSFSGIVILSDYNNISNNDIINNGWGIFLSNSWYNTIEGNVLSNPGYIHLENSCYNKIKGNSFSNNGGINLQSYNNNNLVEGNIIDGGGGIVLEGGINNTIKCNMITNNFIGIRHSDSNSIIENNIFSNIYWGIELHGWYNTIINNSFINGGIKVYGSNYNFVENNTVNGKPLIYLEDKSDIILDSETGQIIIINCNNITIKNQKISNTCVGIGLRDTNNCFIVNNTISYNGDGIDLSNSTNNIINNNTICSNGGYAGRGIGIYGHQFNNNKITCNIIKKNDDVGIALALANNNEISDNFIEMNGWSGIYLGYLDYLCEFNMITGNHISKNNNYGILSKYSDDNIIYHNNFIDNIENAYDYCDNIWDDGKYGNYWSDYEERYPDAKPKLFKPWMWNTPYEIPGGNNKDMCPLIKQWPESHSITINKASFNYLFNWYLEKLPSLQRLFNILGSV